MLLHILSIIALILLCLSIIWKMNGELILCGDSLYIHIPFAIRYKMMYEYSFIAIRMLTGTHTTCHPFRPPLFRSLNRINSRLYSYVCNCYYEWLAFDELYREFVYGEHPPSVCLSTPTIWNAGMILMYVCLWRDMLKHKCTEI